MDLVRAVGEPSSLKSSLRFCSAGKKPGVIELTRTPLAAHSRARNWVRLKTADRKSTRLNSSHSQISYAVFCLKKKRTKTNPSETEASRMRRPSITKAPALSSKKVMRTHVAHSDQTGKNVSAYGREYLRACSS